MSPTSALVGTKSLWTAHEGAPACGDTTHSSKQLVPFLSTIPHRYLDVRTGTLQNELSLKSSGLEHMDQSVCYLWPVRRLIAPAGARQAHPLLGVCLIPGSFLGRHPGHYPQPIPVEMSLEAKSSTNPQCQDEEFGSRLQELPNGLARLSLHSGGKPSCRSSTPHGLRTTLIPL